MESRLEESQRWMAKARSSLTAAEKLLEEKLFAALSRFPNLGKPELSFLAAIAMKEATKCS